MAGIRKQAVKDTRELESKGLENTTLIKRLTTKTLLKSENQIIYLDSGLGTYLERILNSKDHIMSLQQIERINLLELLISLCATDESMNKLMEYGDPFPLLGMSTRALVIPELNKDWTIYDVKNLEDLMLFNSKKLPQLSPHLLEHKQREFMVLLTQFEEMEVAERMIQREAFMKSVAESSYQELCNAFTLLQKIKDHRCCHIGLMGNPLLMVYILFVFDRVSLSTGTGSLKSRDFGIRARKAGMECLESQMKQPDIQYLFLHENADMLIPLLLELFQRNLQEECVHSLINILIILMKSGDMALDWEGNLLFEQLVIRPLTQLLFPEVVAGLPILTVTLKQHKLLFQSLLKLAMSMTNHSQFSQALSQTLFKYGGMDIFWYSMWFATNYENDDIFIDICELLIIFSFDESYNPPLYTQRLFYAIMKKSIEDGNGLYMKALAALSKCTYFEKEYCIELYKTSLFKMNDCYARVEKKVEENNLPMELVKLYIMKSVKNYQHIQNPSKEPSIMTGKDNSMQDIHTSMRDGSIPQTTEKGSVGYTTPNALKKGRWFLGENKGEPIGGNEDSRDKDTEGKWYKKGKIEENKKDRWFKGKKGQGEAYKSPESPEKTPPIPIAPGLTKRATNIENLEQIPFMRQVFEENKLLAQEIDRKGFNSHVSKPPSLIHSPPKTRISNLSDDRSQRGSIQTANQSPNWFKGGDNLKVKDQDLVKVKEKAYGGINILHECLEEKQMKTFVGMSAVRTNEGSVKNYEEIVAQKLNKVSGLQDFELNAIKYDTDNLKEHKNGIKMEGRSNSKLNWELYGEHGILTFLRSLKGMPVPKGRTLEKKRSLKGKGKGTITLTEGMGVTMVYGMDLCEGLVGRHRKEIVYIHSMLITYAMDLLILQNVHFILKHSILSLLNSLFISDDASIEQYIFKPRFWLLAAAYLNYIIPYVHPEFKFSLGLDSMEKERVLIWDEGVWCFRDVEKRTISQIAAKRLYASNQTDLTVGPGERTRNMWIISCISQSLSIMEKGVECLQESNSLGRMQWMEGLLHKCIEAFIILHKISNQPSPAQPWSVSLAQWDRVLKYITQAIGKLLSILNIAFTAKSTNLNKIFNLVEREASFAKALIGSFMGLSEEKAIYSSLSLTLAFLSRNEYIISYLTQDNSFSNFVSEGLSLLSIKIIATLSSQKQELMVFWNNFSELPEISEDSYLKAKEYLNMLINKYEAIQAFLHLCIMVEGQGHSITLRTEDHTLIIEQFLFLSMLVDDFSELLGKVHNKLTVDANFMSSNKYKYAKALNHNMKNLIQSQDGIRNVIIHFIAMLSFDSVFLIEFMNKGFFNFQCKQIQKDIYKEPLIIFSFSVVFYKISKIFESYPPLKEYFSIYLSSLAYFILSGRTPIEAHALLLEGLKNIIGDCSNRDLERLKDISPVLVGFLSVEYPQLQTFSKLSNSFVPHAPSALFKRNLEAVDMKNDSGREIYTGQTSLQENAKHLLKYLRKLPLEEVQYLKRKIVMKSDRTEAGLMSLVTKESLKHMDKGYQILKNNRFHLGPTQQQKYNTVIETVQNLTPNEINVALEVDLIYAEMLLEKNKSKL